MAEKRERKPLFTSPLGIATGYVYLNKPDTEGEYADDKYKVVMAFDADDTKIQELMSDLDDKSQAAYDEAIEKYSKKKDAKTKKNLAKFQDNEPYVPYEEELDEDTGEPRQKLISI